MKLTTQEEYGLRCLLQLARPDVPGSLTIPELSKREGISAANVAKIMRVLRKAGFVRSIRGQSGGYALARPADQIVVSDVIARLGSPLYDATFCQRHSGVSDSCAHLGDCSIRPVLRHVQDAIDEVLGRLTLASLLRSEREVAAWTGARGRALPVVSVTEGRDAGN
jgi:Rrf2 family transcriptional regulator, iron-sulfur cluster assembly transcription factor